MWHNVASRKMYEQNTKLAYLFLKTYFEMIDMTLEILQTEAFK